MSNKHWLDKSKEKDTSSMLYKILNILIYCFDIFCVLLFVFYIVGNYQNFEDKSQKIILNALSYASICTCLLSIAVIIDNIFILFGKGNKKRTVKSLIGMIITVIFSILLIGVSSVLTFLSSGF